MDFFFHLRLYKQQYISQRGFHYFALLNVYFLSPAWCLCRGGAGVSKSRWRAARWAERQRGRITGPCGDIIARILIDPCPIYSGQVEQVIEMTPSVVTEPWKTKSVRHQVRCLLSSGGNGRLGINSKWSRSLLLSEPCADLVFHLTKIDKSQEKMVRSS